jgi:hypothetical protein
MTFHVSILSRKVWSYHSSYSHYGYSNGSLVPSKKTHPTLIYVNRFAYTPLPTGGGAPSSDLLHRGRWSWSPFPPLAAPTVTGGRGISFLHSGLVVRVRFCLSWRNIGMVGAASGWINLPQLYSHIGDDLQGGASELMAMCADRSFRSAASDGFVA